MTDLQEPSRFENISIEQLLGDENWKLLCPFLTVRGAAKVETGDTGHSQISLNPCLKGSLVEDGFFELADFSKSICLELCTKLAKGIQLLVSYGYSPTFIYAYDEAD